MNQKCKNDQTNQIDFLQYLKQICTQKFNQLLNFPVHTQKYIWFISGCLLDAYRLGFKVAGLDWPHHKAILFIVSLPKNRRMEWMDRKLCYVEET